MDTLLEDYKAYYKARMDRYENDPNFTHSYQSEKALFEAMNSCSELAEFKDKIGDLNIKNAIALVKDQESARLKHYHEYQEDIRALGPKWILEKIDGAADANAVVTISSELEQKASIEITLDGFIDVVYQDLIPLLETLEVTEKAEIPAKYESDRQEQVAEIRQQISERIKDTNQQAQNWNPNWSLNLELVWEHRHRKKIPLNDAVLRQRLTELKTFA